MTMSSITIFGMKPASEAVGMSFRSVGPVQSDLHRSVSSLIAAVNQSNDVHMFLYFTQPFILTLLYDVPCNQSTKEMIKMN